MKNPSSNHISNDWLDDASVGSEPRWVKYGVLIFNGNGIAIDSSKFFMRPDRCHAGRYRLFHVDFYWHGNYFLANHDLIFVHFNIDNVYVSAIDTLFINDVVEPIEQKRSARILVAKLVAQRERVLIRSGQNCLKPA